MRTKAGALLFDTHVWIWLNEGLPELSVERRQSIEDAARRGEVWVSIISVWEVSLRHPKRRLQLGTSCLDWARRALAPPLALATPTPEIAVECNSLPGQFHDDPGGSYDRGNRAPGGPDCSHPGPADPRVRGGGYVSALPC
jgi:PIN domain nuclease of toxin-antitoxin system